MTCSVTVASEVAVIRDSWAPAEKFPGGASSNMPPPPIKTTKDPLIAKNGPYNEKKSSIKAPTWKKKLSTIRKHFPKKPP